jgi:hypothetical protein
MRVAWFWRKIPEKKDYWLPCDTCAICRLSLANVCSPLCRERQQPHDEWQASWFIMLLIRQRLVPTLPRDILMMILNEAWKKTEEMHELECPLSTLLVCGHVFHWHCLEHWFTKIVVNHGCPLCNRQSEHQQLTTEAKWTKSYVLIIKLLKK